MFEELLMFEELHLVQWFVYAFAALWGSMAAIFLKRKGVCIPRRQGDFYNMGSFADVFLAIFLSYGLMLAEIEGVFPMTPFLCWSICISLISIAPPLRERLVMKFMPPVIQEILEEIKEEEPAPEPVPESEPVPEPVLEPKPQPEPVPA